MDPRKTILFTNVGADMYGADYVLLCLVRHLDPEKYRRIILVPYAGPLVQELEKCGAEVIVREFPVLRRSVFTPLGLLKFAWQMTCGLFFILRLARSENIDVFHTNTATLWPPGLAARIVGKPHIWQVMELVEKPLPVCWVIAKMTGIFSDRVFCISNSVRDHFLRYNPSRTAKFQTLYHGVETVQYSPETADGKSLRQALKIPDQAVVVLYAGRFSAWKGQDIFAQAIPLILRQTDKDVRFIMIGSCFQGQEEHGRELEETLASFSLPEGIVFLRGFQNDLPNWMNASDIFVLPSKNPEPNATVLIGAMTMGLPCIGTRIGGTTETIVHGKTGIHIAPSSVEELAAAVIQLVENSGQRLAFGAAGRDRARQVFSMRQYCETIAKAYDNQ